MRYSECPHKSQNTGNNGSIRGHCRAHEYPKYVGISWVNHEIPKKVRNSLDNGPTAFQVRYSECPQKSQNTGNNGSIRGHCRAHESSKNVGISWVNHEMPKNVRNSVDNGPTAF